MPMKPGSAARTAALAATFASLIACGHDEGYGAPAGKAPSKAARGIAFEDVTAASGIRFSRTFGGHEFDNIVKSVGGGVAVLDADGDGWMDLYFVNGGFDPDVTGTAKAEGNPRAALWRNRHDGTFEDVTEKAGVANEGAYGFGAAAADYDGDGLTDLYVCNYRGNRLYHNEGGGRFSDVTEKAGVRGDAWSVHAVWLDYDRDGLLDLYVVTYLTFDPKYRVFYAPEGFPGPLSYSGATDVLYRNRGDGTFEDVTRKAGVYLPGGRGMSAVAADFDQDGWPDVFVSEDAMENTFWHNRGDGTFENLALSNGTAYGLNGESTSAMGPAVADYNRDGWLDLYVPDGAFSCLYTNLGPVLKAGTAATVAFRDRSAEARVAGTAAQNVGWGGLFLDADDDGWPDLFRSNGDDHHLFAEQSTLLANRGGGTFADVSREAGDFFLSKRVGRGAAVADLWNEGKQSIVMQTADGSPVLLRNRRPDGPHWLQLDLQGDPKAGPKAKSTRAAVGARVLVTGASGVETDEVRAGSGYLSTSDPRLHFGLGADAGPVKVEVVWPSGARQTIPGVAVDRIVKVVENETR